MRFKTIKEPSREISVIKEVDVVVAGGGVAGLAAAVSAARSGVNTLLVERYGCLGGTMSGVPMEWIGGYNPGVHGGFTKELIEKLRNVNGIIREFFNPKVAGLMVGVYIDVLKDIALQMLEEAGAKLLLHALVVDAIAENNKAKGIIIESKSGREAILARIVIDATGDGDVAVKAKAPYEKGRKSDKKMQPMTLYGPMMEGVNTEKLLESLLEYKDKYPEEILESDVALPSFVFGGFSELLKKAKEKEDIYLDYDTIWIKGNTKTNVAIIDGTCISNVDGTNVFDLTYAETESIKQASSFITFVKKYFPGFENSRRVDRGSFSIGVRETRRIMGEYILTEEDVLNGKIFDDVICRNTTPIDIHTPEGCQIWTQVKPYDIPYRCLIPQKIENFLVSGRCISCTHKALASVRFIPCCMATGQAAGVASALAVKTNVTPRLLDIAELQALLRKQNVVLNGKANEL